MINKIYWMCVLKVFFVSTGPREKPVNRELNQWSSVCGKDESDQQLNAGWQLWGGGRSLDAAHNTDKATYSKQRWRRNTFSEFNGVIYSVEWKML